MIRIAIVEDQLEDFIDYYNIDKEKVYANGYSGGGGALFSNDREIMGWLFEQ
ncbi:MAG: hypothetical protein PHQ72_06435 [Hespellia sp.]|nr:hypothetical protein [Hespellia sp.]